jgi:hypothetical protein
MPLSKPGFPIPREEIEEDDSPESEDRGRESGITFRGYPDDCPTPSHIPAAVQFLERIPILRVAMNELCVLPLDHRTGFVLSRIDGRLTIESLLDVCGMQAEEVILILDELIEFGIVSLI